MMVLHSMVSLVGRYTKLSYNERTKKYHGKCPFCHSGTEVFCVDNKNAAFWCYSCGKHGGMEDCKIHAGLTAPQQGTEPEDQGTMEIYAAAAAYYYGCLAGRTGTQAYAYITEERGLGPETLADFGIGYAPYGGGNQSLYRHLKKRFDDPSIFRSGLVKRGKYGPYDMFRNRIMFPILDREGRVVAFGGRCLDGRGPKYLNSAESRIFNKHTILYGFQTAAEASKIEDTLLVCEGYMDLIALQAHGVRNSAAVLGTALTKEHAKLIRCFYKKVRLALDSDGPGIQAMARSIPVLEDAGLSVDTMSFSPAKDPDEFFRLYGKETLKAHATHGSDPSMLMVRASAEPEAELVRQLVKRFRIKREEEARLEKTG